MSIVRYEGKKVSDKHVIQALENIARYIGPVNVTSGDRSHVPKGGSPTSLHLSNSAADFWVSGLTLEEVFQKIIDKRNIIFDSGSQYEVILHGKFTITGGPHLHIGRYGPGGYIYFKKEGTSKETKGIYSVLI